MLSLPALLLLLLQQLLTVSVVAGAAVVSDTTFVSEADPAAAEAAVPPNHDNDNDEDDYRNHHTNGEFSDASVDPARGQRDDNGKVSTYGYETASSSSSSSSLLSRMAQEGTKSDGMTGRIVGGTPARPGAFPWLVALFNAKDPSFVLPVCAGSLITPSVVLTAAHCIASIQSAMVGRHDFSVMNEEGAEVFTDLKKAVHPLYRLATFDFDYALIKLDRPYPNPVLMNLRTTPELPIEMTIMGWGVTAQDGVQPTTVMEANVTRFDDVVCSSNYDPSVITDNMFCARQPGVDSCQGDSGGPIVIPGTNVQVGIVSWGNGCADPIFPGVYARIDSGFDWIEQTVCEDLSPGDCQDGQLPMIDEQGQPRDVDCQDLSGEFLGLGKRLKRRSCAWVGDYPERRCPWYGPDYCPATCNVDRCK